MKQAPSFDRRDFLKGGASLLFMLRAGTVGIVPIAGANAQSRWDGAREIGPTSLDTWLAVSEDGGVTAFFGKMDMGQGVDTAIAQVVAEELDVSVDRVEVVMGDTHRTANQGGASGSSGCRQGANPLRNAAAEARRVFLARASEHLGAPVAALSVADGRVFISSNPNISVTYGELITNGFNTNLDWNQQYGNGLLVTGTAQPKRPADYTVVGASVPRKDIPGKILATTEFCHHVALPGMLHGRTIRPPVANAVPVAVDESSIAAIAGARVVWKQDFIAVVAESEWDAIKAARQLNVSWSDTPPPFPRMDALFDHIRNAPVAADNSVANFGGRRDYDPQPSLDAIAASARSVEGEYEVPFQSHARMGPSVGVADVRNGEALVFSDTQKSHNTRDGIAKILELAPDKVRVIWKPGPGSYGRSDADEAAFEAAVLSQEIGRPVRVQWMRDEGHGWDPKAPACLRDQLQGRHRCERGNDRLVLSREGLLRLGRAVQRRGSERYAHRPTARLEQRRRAQLRRPRRVVRVSECGQVLGDDPAAARARLAAALRAHARAAGAAAPFRAGVLHRRGRGCGRRRSDRAALETPD
jgi:nicotinate dehydrogenase subunit B